VGAFLNWSGVTGDMSDYNASVLLCGDPQQPVNVMREGMLPLIDSGVDVEDITWHGEMSAEAFRNVTMDMERLGPSQFDAKPIIEAINEKDILVVHKAPVTREVFEIGQNLDIVAAARGGVENIDLEAADEFDVTVLHAPGRNANAVADYAVSFALSAHRNIPGYVQSSANGKWDLQFDPDGLPQDISSLKIGVVGLGNIGRGVARRWQGFGAQIIGHDPYVPDKKIEELGATPASLEETLVQADILTLHVRLSESTAHLIDAEALELMSPSAILVNTARGGLVDTNALINALKMDVIGGAALDVFEQEPLPDESPLMKLPNVWLSPHTAGSTRDAVVNGSKIIRRDLVRMLNGEKPEFSAN
jgi:D-3-phosphoglycerate dehydrogenase